ncbi:SAG1386/EF1546 family surface-associated protein [Limosilactobacillus viscerum]|uniref:SAG1386/EF1546 family surface-associated protein n=1 Tax=Limosilactobacillus viscerum TaxID=2993450 RepID=UPI0024BB3C3D|nr:SAG1386/EF1546 family surface-associated protein [Limosilactobacillus viscerum]
MSEKREESREQNDELWDKKFTDNENLDSTGHLSRTERRKQESHSSTITTVLIVLIIVLAATPLIYWINNKQSFNHPVQTEQTASASSKKSQSHRVSSASRRHSVSRSEESSSLTSSSSAVTSSRSASTSSTSVSQGSRQYAVVRRGDSIYRIAARNGMSAQEVARLNNLSVNSTVHPGQQIRVR